MDRATCRNTPRTWFQYSNHHLIFMSGSKGKRRYKHPVTGRFCSQAEFFTVALSTSCCGEEGIVSSLRQPQQVPSRVLGLNKGGVLNTYLVEDLLVVKCSDFGSRGIFIFPNSLSLSKSVTLIINLQSLTRESCRKLCISCY